MANSTEKQQFEYGTFFRFIFLWLPYLVVLLGILMLIWTFTTEDFPPTMSAFLIMWLLIGAILLSLLLGSIPIKIQLTNGYVALWRHRRYREIPLHKITCVETDILWPYGGGIGGWIRFDYEQDGKTGKFYVGPFVNNYLDLVKFINQQFPNSCTCERTVFSWTGVAAIVMTLTIIIALVLLVMAIVTNSIAFSLFILIFLMASLWNAWALATKVELNDEYIQVHRLFRQPIEVSWKEIDTIRNGFGKLFSAGGFTIYTIHT